MTYQHIRDIIADIEGNLFGDLHPEEIAKAHYISPSQLYKDFYACTGYSVKEYIRQRRISNACALLRSSELSLDYIAYHSGLQTQQAFHKQFRKLVGMTPVEYRNSDSVFYFSPATFLSLHPANEDLSITVRVGNERIPACKSRLYLDVQAEGMESRALANYTPDGGRVFGRNGPQSGNRYCYEILTETEGPATEGLYATCIVPFESHTATRAWNLLYNVWLPCSMFEQADEPYLEEIFFRSGKPVRLKLYLPVKKRTTAVIHVAEDGPFTFLTSSQTGPDAEQIASRRVVDFVRVACPWLLQAARRFITSWKGDVVECGIELPAGHSIAAQAGLLIRHIPRSTYATLSGPCLGDIRLPARQLDEWLCANGIACRDERTFAIYDSLDGRLDTSHINMTVYRAVQF